MAKINTVPIWLKYALNVDEAVAYFNIGESVLRRFIKDHEDETFIIRNGVKILIKRRAFEDYLDKYVTAV